MGDGVSVGRALIGAVVQEPGRVMGMAADRGLVAGHFLTACEGRVWALLCELWERKGILDLLMAQQELEREGVKLDGEPWVWLSECVDLCITATHAESYIDQVIEGALRRDLSRVAMELAADVGNEPDVRGVGERASQQVMDLLDGACGEDVGESNAEAAARIAEKYCSGEMGVRRIGLEWPWENVTTITCGLEPGMIVLAGRPSAGKTSIEDSLAVALASQGIPVGRVTLDGSRDELLARAQSRHAEVSLPKLKFGYARENERAAFREAAALMGKYPMFFEERRRNLDGILARAREWKRKYDIQLLTVDFIQLITTGNPHVDMNQVTRVGMISAALKGLALELKIPVLALSQLSRAMEKENREPQLSDLRGSGDIEQDAHQVIFVHVDTKSRKAMEEERPGWTKKVRPVWFDLLKNKDGEVGRIPLLMYPNYFKFEEPSENRDMDLANPRTMMDFDGLMEMGLMRLGLGIDGEGVSGRREHRGGTGCRKDGE